MEVIRPGAFANALKENQDVRALFNHDATFILGRTKAGTCRLSEDARGLYFEADLADSQILRDLVVTPMRRGDLDQCSFAFLVRPGGERITIREEDDVIIEDRARRRWKARA
jgi:HK97 family phage prohead protease